MVGDSWDDGGVLRLLKTFDMGEVVGKGWSLSEWLVISNILRLNIKVVSWCLLIRCFFNLHHRLVVEVVELFQCYLSSVSGLSPRSAEFPGPAGLSYRDRNT